MNHTPGPWEAIKKENDECYWISPLQLPAIGRRVVAEVNFGFVEPAESEQHANAALIAAAPELLELAKDYAEHCRICHGTGWADAKQTGHCTACNHIWDLIAKAEGRS